MNSNFSSTGPLVPAETTDAKPRVIVSTDIGGTDPDDFQSMIHYLMYADRFDTEGLISSPYGPGRKEDILKIINLYEKDYSKLRVHARDFPPADKLRALTKQGAIGRAPANGWSLPTEGSRWIISRARSKDPRPLWVLVWGGLEDLAQALHDAPDIAPRLRVYWIGGPNKKWSLNAYLYIARHFPGLWMIEANSTYRGWFEEGDLSGAPGDGFAGAARAGDTGHHGPGNKAFFEKHIQGAGYLGADFANYYEGEIKMGDSPSVAYLLYGDSEDPAAPGWGGSFIKLPWSARRVFRRNTSLNDTVPVYGVIEWIFEGPDTSLAKDAPCLRMEVSGQTFDGYYQGEGLYLVRFVPKSSGEWNYRITGAVEGFGTREGAFVSSDPWPGTPHNDNITGLTGWWSDDPDPALFLNGWQGAQTVARWRKAWLDDWAERWSWLR